MEQQVQLTEWLADGARLQGTREAIAAYAEEWRRGPVRALFDAAFGEDCGHDAETIARIAANLFANHDWTETLIQTLCERLQLDPMFRPPFRALNNELLSGLLVYENPRVLVAASVLDLHRLAAKKSRPRDKASINFTGRLSVFKFVRSGDARLSFWEIDPITAQFTAAAAGRCRRTGERVIADGELVVVDGRRQSFVVEHARSNIVLLEAAISQDKAALAVEYDSAGLDYVSCSATDEVVSRVQVISTLARKLGARDAFAAIAPFLTHEDFFLRWHVMKELLGIDLEAALPHLRKMAAGDPHPEPRRAARSLLDRLEAPRPRQAA